MIFRDCLRLSAALAACAAAQPVYAAQPAGYRLAARVTLGAPDRWDYVVFDPHSDRVFVAHSDRVTVVDGRAGRVIGQVEGTPGGSHGTAISTATGQGFTDDGKAGQAVVFDLKTLRVLKRIPAAADADGIVVDSASGHVFVADGDSGKVTAIDPRMDAPLADIEIGGKLEGIDADADGRVYVAGAEKRELTVLDSRSNSIVARFPIPACESPHGVAADSASHRVFVTCANARMLVLNSGTGAAVATPPIGRGSDAAAWDPKRKRAFSPNGRDGTVSVIQQLSPDTYKVLAPVPTQRSARTMAVDPASGRLFVAALDLQRPPGPGLRPKAPRGSLKLLIFAPVK